MRVLAMLHLYSPHHNAGAETTAHELLKTLTTRGHEVVVQLSQSHPGITGRYTYDGVRVFPHVDQGDPLKWITSGQPPHLIVTHLENTLRASILGGMHNIPVAVLMHNALTKSMADLRWGARLAVYNTNWMRRDVESWWESTHGVPGGPRGIVVHPPIHPGEYRVEPPTARNGHITLINLYAEKGAEVFYALAARFPRLKFLAVHGAYGEQIIRDLPNVEHVEHLAPGEMPARVYARTRVLLMPSSYESYGRCGVEAACSGIPTIAHPTDGLVEALGDGGTFVDRDDHEGWAAALTTLMTTKGWAAASARTQTIVDGLDPDTALLRWAEAAEATAGHPALQPA